MGTRAAVAVTALAVIAMVGGILLRRLGRLRSPARLSARPSARASVAGLAGVLAVGAGLWAASAHSTAATPLSVTIANGSSGGDLVLTSSTYGNAKTVVNGASSALSLPLPIPDLSSLGVTNASATADDTTRSVVIQGDVTVKGFTTSLQLSAIWPTLTSTSPAVALAIKPGGSDLAALNSLWSGAPVNPTLTSAVVLVSPTAGTGFDTSKLPTAAQAFYPVAGAMTVGQGASLVATLDASSDPNLSSALALLGEGNTVTIRGTLGASIASVLDSAATDAQKAGLDLSVSVSGAPTHPQWVTQRTSTVELKVPSSGPPAVTLDDTMTVNLNGATNTFVGHAAYVPSAFGGPSVSLSYGLQSGTTLAVPFGLDSLTLGSPSFTLSHSATGFSGDFGTDVTLGSAHTVHLDASVADTSGTLSASLSLAGTVTSADIVTFGNALLGTGADASSLGSSISLTGVTFSFSKTGSDQQMSLTASATIRSLTADVLVSLRHTGTASPTLILGLQLHDTASSCNCISVDKLVGGSLSGLVSGLKLPQVELLGTVGFGATSGPVSIATSTLSGAETAFLHHVYGLTLPSTITLQPKLTFAGAVTVPDAVGSVFGMASGSQVVLSGDLGIDLGAFGTASSAPALSGSLTAELPAMTATLPSWLGGATSTTWSLNLAADSASTIQLGISSDSTISASVNGTPYVVSVSGAISTGSAGTAIDLKGTVTGTFTIFGASWLSATDPTVHLHIDSAHSSTTFAASLETTLTIGSAHAFVAATVSDANGTSGSIEVTLQDPVSLNDAVTAMGANLTGSGLPTLTISALDARFADGTGGASFDLTATTSVTLPSNSTPFTSNLLLSVTGGSTTRILAGIEPTGSVSLSDVVGSSNLPGGVDFTFPQFGIVVSHPQQTLNPSTLAGRSHDFFAPFCADAASPCATSLALSDGVTILSATTVPSSLHGLLNSVHSDASAPVIVSGSLPVFSGSLSGFNLTVALPRITGSSTTPDMFESGGVLLRIGSTALTLDGQMTFNIAKGSSVTDATTCTNEGGVWRAPRGSTTNACYDQVPFDLGATISLSPVPGMTLTGGLDQSYLWQAPMGQTWLTLSAATVEFGVQITGPAPTFTLGFDIGFSIANHDFFGAIKASVTVTPTPPFLVPNLIGFRVDSQTGISMQDVVDMASTVSGQSLSLNGVPNLAVRNVSFGFSEENDSALCLVQGLHLAGELYINPSSSVALHPAAGCPPTQTDLGTQCAADSSNGCFAAVDLAIDQNGIKAAGTLGAFAVGPLSFGGAMVDLTVSPTVQRLILKGSVDITGFASGSIDLLVSSSQLHFRGHADLLGSTIQAFLDGNASYSLTNLASLKNPPSFSVNAVLKADFLSAAGVAISGTLQALKPAIQALDVVLGDIANGNLLDAVVDVPIQIANMGVSLPSPWGTEISTISSKLSDIRSAIDAFGHVVTYGINDLLNGFDLTFPGIPGFYTDTTCLGTWSGGSCYSIPPFCAGFLGCSDGVPGVVVPGVCVTTVVNGTCYSIPPATAVHIPGLCDALRLAVPSLGTCDVSNLTTLIQGALGQAFKALTGYDLGNIGMTLSNALDSLARTLGTGSTIAIDCAQFTANVVLGTTPSASVTMASDIDLFGNHLNFGLGWNFAPNSSNVGQDILDVIDAVFHPVTTTCSGLPADWNTNASYPDAVGTGPVASGQTSLPPVNPTMSIALGAREINENGTASLSGTLTPAPTTPQTVNITWGNGDTSSVTTSSANFSTTHTYGDVPVGSTATQYSVRAQWGSGPTATTQVTVRETPPTNLTLGSGPLSATEGVPFTLNGSFGDASGSNSHTVTIDWGDGHLPQTLSTLPAGTTTFAATHTWGDESPTGSAGYSVGVTVTDDDGGRIARSTVVPVANSTPSAVSIVSSAPTAPEQQDLNFTISFTDPSTDTHSAYVTWGDGTPSITYPMGALRSVQVQHRYTEADTAAHPDGHYPVSVVVSDDDTGDATGVSPAAGTTQVITNLAPTSLTWNIYDPRTPLPSPGPAPAISTIAEGVSTGVTVQGGFADLSGSDSHTVTIDWGTGWLADRYQTINLAAGVFTFTANREYGDNGIYPIVVTVADDDGATVSSSHTLTVTNVAPTAGINRTTSGALSATTFLVQGVPVELVHAGHVLPMSEQTYDPGSDDIFMNWTWGDGTPAPPTVNYYNNAPTNTADPALSPQVNPRNITDLESHTYANVCPYTINLGVRDDDGGSAADHIDVVVQGNGTQLYDGGQWKNNITSGSPIPPAQMNCYIRAIDRLSTVFGPSATATRQLATTKDASFILQPTASNPTWMFDRDLLAVWLDFVYGSYDWNTPVYVGGATTPVPFHTVVEQAESLRTNPATTATQLAAARVLLGNLEHTAALIPPLVP